MIKKCISRIERLDYEKTSKQKYIKSAEVFKIVNFYSLNQPVLETYIHQNILNRRSMNVLKVHKWLESYD